MSQKDLIRGLNDDLAAEWGMIIPCSHRPCKEACSLRPIPVPWAGMGALPDAPTRQK